LKPDYTNPSKPSQTLLLLPNIKKQMQHPLNIKKLFACNAAINYIFLLLFFFFYSSYCNAQGKEANIWYFGWGAWIDFNQGTHPTALTNSQMYILSGNYCG